MCLRTKLLSTLAAVVFAGAGAYASNIPYYTGPIQPDNLSAALNNLIQQINADVAGLFAFIPGPIASTATTNEQVLAQAVIPTNSLTAAGQSFRLKCGGITAADTNTKSAKLYLGTTSISTGNFTTSAETWELELLVSLAQASPPTSSVYIGRGTINTTVVAPVAGNNTTDAFNGALTAKCTATQGAASASDVTLENFIIEQVK